MKRRAAPQQNHGAGIMVPTAQPARAQRGQERIMAAEAKVEAKAEAKSEARRSVALVQGAAAAGAAQGRKMMEDGASQARSMMEKNMEQATKTAETFYKSAEEVAEFGRGNLEAFTKATQVLAAGMQDLGKQYFAMSQALTDHAMESAKALSGVKSMKEAADIQAAFAKAALERTMSEATKLQEATFRVAEQASAPLTARMQVAMQKMGKPLAA
jgi:phasin family protein